MGAPIALKRLRPAAVSACSISESKPRLPPFEVEVEQPRGSCLTFALESHVDAWKRRRTNVRAIAATYTHPTVHHAVISTILRHDSKQTSYNIALLRSLNDVVLAYPDVGHDGRPVAQGITPCGPTCICTTGHGCGLAVQRAGLLS